MPLEITGRIQPFKKDLFVDLKASFKDVDLSPVSPYSGRYVGYSIQKGKLSFDLKYLIDNKKLESEKQDIHRPTDPWRPGREPTGLESSHRTGHCPPEGP